MGSDPKQHPIRSWAARRSFLAAAAAATPSMARFQIATPVGQPRHAVFHGPLAPGYIPALVRRALRSG